MSVLGFVTALDFAWPWCPRYLLMHDYEVCSWYSTCWSIRASETFRSGRAQILFCIGNQGGQEGSGGLTQASRWAGGRLRAEPYLYILSPPASPQGVCNPVRFCIGFFSQVTCENSACHIFLLIKDSEKFCNIEICLILVHHFPNIFDHRIFPTFTQNSPN